MERTVFEMKFKVTETCQNGNERRITKTVFSTFDGIDFNRETKAYNLLRGKHYYNIEYLGGKYITLLTVD